MAEFCALSIGISIPSVKGVASFVQPNQSKYQFALVEADAVHAIHAGLGISFTRDVYWHNII